MTSRRIRRHRPRDEHGSTTLELVVLTPGLLTVLAAVLIAGRYENAAAAVEQAAAVAARAASLTRTPSLAAEAARHAATDTLDQHGLHCGALTVTTRTTTAPAGPGAAVPGRATVTVTCRLDLSTLTVPGMPGRRDVSSHAVSVIDTYRAAP